MTLCGLWWLHYFSVDRTSILRRNKIRCGSLNLQLWAGLWNGPNSLCRGIQTWIKPFVIVNILLLSLRRIRRNGNVWLYLWELQTERSRSDLPIRPRIGWREDSCKVLHGRGRYWVNAYVWERALILGVLVQLRFVVFTQNCEFTKLRDVYLSVNILNWKFYWRLFDQWLLWF